MSYSKQTWDTTSYVNPTRMNHIEDGIDGALPKDGGTMTGDLTLGKASTALKIRGSGSRYINITSSAQGSDKDIVLPNKSGTLALTDDKISTFPITPVNDTSISRYMVYKTGLTGNVTAGQTKDFGTIPIPTGYSAIINVFFAPDANLPLILTYYGGHVYCYSLTYTGTVSYAVLMLCDK